MYFQQLDSPYDVPSTALPPPPASVQRFERAQSSGQTAATQLSTYLPEPEAIGVGIDDTDDLASSHARLPPHYTSAELKKRRDFDHASAQAPTFANDEKFPVEPSCNSSPGIHRPCATKLAAINIASRPIAPPRAVFVEDGRPQSATSSSSSVSLSMRSALEFGDAPSTLRAARAKQALKQSIDWTRFSVQFKDDRRWLNDSEVDQSQGGMGAGPSLGLALGSSDWLRRRQGLVKRWTRIGVLGVLALVVVIVVIVVACVKKSRDSTRSTSSLQPSTAQSETTVIPFSSDSVDAPFVPTTASSGSILTATRPRASITAALNRDGAVSPTPTTDRSTRSTTTASTGGTSTAVTPAMWTLATSSVTGESSIATKTSSDSTAAAATSASDRTSLQRRHSSHVRPRNDLNHGASATRAPATRKKRFFNPIHVEYAELYSNTSIFTGSTEDDDDDEDEYMKVKQDKLRTRAPWRRDHAAAVGVNYDAAWHSHWQRRPELEVRGFMREQKASRLELVRSETRNGMEGNEIELKKR